MRIARLIWLCLLVALWSTLDVQGQTPLLNETFDAGTQGWVVENGVLSHRWKLEPASPSDNNTTVMRIAEGEGAATYGTGAGLTVVYLWRELRFAASGTDYLLSFDWKAPGAAEGDVLKVYLTDANAPTPKAGVLLTPEQILGVYPGLSQWSTYVLRLPQGLAGKAMRLVFAWQAADSWSQTSGAALDNIKVEAFAPMQQSMQCAPGQLGGLVHSQRLYITSLKLCGIIDARDVRYLRDSMPLLEQLDMQAVQLAAYEGTGGTVKGSRHYPAHQMPRGSFYNEDNFQSKLSLHTMVLPAGLTSIGAHAFDGCKGLSGTLILPRGVQHIGQLAFSECINLTGRLTLPAGLLTIDDGAFRNCRSLTGSLQLPAGLTTLGEFAFQYCAGLSGTLQLPAGITQLSAGAFAHCQGLTGAPVLPDGLTEIGHLAFAYCTGLNGQLQLPRNLATIGMYAFRGCSGLQGTLVLPDSVVSIGQEAFKDCSRLGTLVLPQGLNEIQPEAFSGCVNLGRILNYSMQPVPIGRGVFDYINLSGCLLVVPQASLHAYKQAPVWQDFKLQTNLLVQATAANGLGSVEGSPMGFYPQGAQVRFQATAQAGVPFLGWYTPDGSKVSLQPSLDITVNSDTILLACFGQQPKVWVARAGTLGTILTQPLQVVSLTVEGNIDARDVRYMRDSLPHLQWLDLSQAQLQAYEGTAGTAEGHYYYPALELPAYAFYNDSADQGKQSLRKVQLPATLLSVGDMAFAECHGLSEWTSLPQGLLSIGEAAWQGCVRLRGTLLLPEGLLEVQPEAFRRCIGIRALSVPASIHALGRLAFAECSGLVSVTSHRVVPLELYGTKAFDHVACEGCTLVVPSSGVAAYRKAALWSEFAVQAGGLLVQAYAQSSALGTVVGAPAQGLRTSGGTIKLKAQPAPQMRFVGWYNLQGTRVSSKPQLSLTPTTDTVLVAYFGRQEQIKLKQAGTLATLLSKPETIVALTLSGPIDARDVRYLRQHMPRLAHLNLSQATIQAYSGTQGTLFAEQYSYPAHTLPPASFTHPGAPRGSLALRTIQLPVALEAIGTEAFKYCVGLGPTLVLPPTVHCIEVSAFEGCTGLVQVLLPVALDTLQASAFEDCINLHTPILPQQLVYIGNSAFAGCTSLAGTLVLPAALKQIGVYAFNNYLHLQRVECLSHQPATLHRYSFAPQGATTATIAVPTLAVQAYKSAAGWQHLRIEDGGLALAYYSSQPMLGSVQGTPAGLYGAGHTIQLQAQPNKGSVFEGWYTPDGRLVSTLLQFSTVPDTDMVLEARFTNQAR